MESMAAHDLGQLCRERCKTVERKEPWESLYGGPNGAALSQRRKWHIRFGNLLALLIFDLLPVLSALVALTYSFTWTRSAQSDGGAV